MGDSPASVLVDPADGTSLKIATDGSDRKLDITTKIRKSDGTLVNPATEDTLALIKTTDGIKKIVDPLPAGDNNIGNVDVASALPAGDNNIGNVDIASALPAGDNNIGNVDVASALPAGDNNIGDVDIASALPAGDNNIGNVDLASPIPAGTNEVGKVAQGTRAAASAGWPLYIVDDTGNKVGVILDGAIYRLQTQAKIVRASDGAQINPATEETLALIKTTDGIKKIVDALPTGDNTIGRAKVTDGTTVLGIETGTQAKVSLWGMDQSSTLRRVMLIQDETDEDLYRIAISGKVSVTIPPPPPGGTKVTISADNPLIVSQAISPHLTEWTVTDGKTLYIQQVIAGCQGDPTANGSKVEVYYYDGSTEHLVERIYILGQTQFGNYPDTGSARDGTVMIGSGTARKLRIYRSRLSNSSQEIDAVVRGYTI